MTLRAIEVLRSRAARRGRGHAHDAPAVGALRDRHAARPVPRTERAGARTSSCSSTSKLAHDLALVTDAGTPLVSDPGEDLVAAWAARGGRVVPIPGASAVLVALVAAAYRPRAGRSKVFCRGAAGSGATLIERICADERTTRPVRGARPRRRYARRSGRGAAARTAARRCARELTKLHEEIWRGSLGELAARAPRAKPRGEVTHRRRRRRAADDRGRPCRIAGRSVGGRSAGGEGWSTFVGSTEVAAAHRPAARELFKTPNRLGRPCRRGFVTEDDQPADRREPASQRPKTRRARSPGLLLVPEEGLEPRAQSAQARGHHRRRHRRSRRRVRAAPPGPRAARARGAASRRRPRLHAPRLRARACTPRPARCASRASTT